MAEIPSGQVEHERISTSLEVERLDINLYRSRSLWHPFDGRGIFGGQIISQALVSATNCVDAAYKLHSMHCYFLLSASAEVPIIYHIERARDGRSYVTRTVKASQNGRIIFLLVCSFQKPEPEQPSYQWPMPPNVPDPDNCELIEANIEKLLEGKSIPPHDVEYLKGYIRERKRSPIAIRHAGINNSSDGAVVFMYWFKAKSIPKYDASFQKCILSYMSDLLFIGHVRRTLVQTGKMDKGAALAMMTSLDHAIWFYDDDFDCGDWLLYVIESPRAGSGRGVVNGRLHTRSGTLVAITAQEGVARVNTRIKAKL